MEVIYCSRCGSMVPPGGVNDGKYYLIAGEPVCIDCYEKLPPEQHTGATVLKAPKVEGRPPSTKLLSHPRRKPPSTHVMVATQRRPSGRHSSHKIASGSKPRSAAGLFAVAAAFVILALVIVLVAFREGEPEGPVGSDRNVGTNRVRPVPDPEIGRSPQPRPQPQPQPQPQPEPQPQPRPAPEPTQPKVIADGSMVILAETNTSAAIGNKLKVGGTPRYLTVTSTRSVYLRFDLSGLTGPIASARVRLRRSTAARGKKAGFQVQATPVAGDDWKEYELNGTAAPAPGQVLATWESTVKTPEFDVTAQVRAALAADKKLLIRISRAEGKDKQFFTYQSKDAGTGKEGPRLIVVPEK